MMEQTARILYSNRQEESLHLVAAASDLLANCMDYEATLERIANLVVSSLASWCAIDLVTDNYKIERVAVAHHDPAKADLARQMMLKYSAKPTAKRGVYRVIETGRSFLIPHTPESSWAKRADDSEHLRLIMEMGSTSYMCVPLVARDRIVGSVLILSGERTYDKEDLETAQKLSSYIALAVDNVLMFRKMQQAIAARNEFLSIAAHEIRTPLTPIVLHMELLDKLLNQEQVSEAEILKARASLLALGRQVKRLTSFINKTMDLSQIDSSQMQLKLSRVNLSQLTEEVGSGFACQMQATGSTWTHEERGDLRLGLWDAGRLEQLTSNLISNAIKYGEGRPIHTSVTFEEDHVILKVQDQGLGIAEEDQPRIFNPYERVAKRSKISGMGMGMYIVKKIVLAHSGKISVESELNLGTTFTVELPYVHPKLKSLKNKTQKITAKKDG